jgi:hypothetical protein
MTLALANSVQLIPQEVLVNIFKRPPLRGINPKPKRGALSHQFRT